MQLLVTQKTRDRVEYMLNNGKPLRKINNLAASREVSNPNLVRSFAANGGEFDPKGLNWAVYMKIVSYNLRYGGNTEKNNHWQRLIREFLPDVVCAQETLHPKQYLSYEEFSQFRGCVHLFVHHGKWGSAILSRNKQLEEIHLQGYEGWVVGAKIPNIAVNGVSQSVLVFSIHAPSPGPYEPSVKQILNDILRRWDKTPMIIAGDFNVTTALRHPTETEGPNTHGEREILELLRRELGLFNAWQILHPNENLPQTLRWAKDPLPNYHCDGIFVNHSFLPHLVSANVESSEKWNTLSDHNPIVVAIE